MSDYDLDILLVQLQDGREQVRVEAIKKFIQQPSKLAKKQLIQRLKDQSPDVRYWAVCALEALGEPSTLKDVKELLHDSSRLVRMAVVRFVGKKPSKTEFSPLLDMLGDPDDDVRSLASNCLARYPEKMVPKILDELNSNRWLKRNYVFQTILHMGSKAHESISKALEKDKISKEKLYWLVQLVGEFRLRKHFNRLKQILLDNQDEEIVLGVVNTFAKLGISESIPLLANYLDHPSEKIREASIEALSAQGEYAVSFLLERLDDDSRVMKVSSIESLAKIGDVSIAPLLENFYQKDKEGRFWILNALRRLNADVAKSIFMSLCKDEDVDIQLLSISALSEFESSEESLEILLELLDHSLWRIRNESARTLSRLQDLSPEFLIRQLQEGFENRKYWMIKVMEQRSEAVFIKPLLNIFNGEDWVLKTAAADALQQIPYKESEDFIEILNGNSQSLIYWTTRSLIGDQNRDYIEPMINCLDTQSAGTRENAIEFFLKMGKKSHANLREVFRENHSRQTYLAVVDILSHDRSSAQSIFLELLRSTNREEIYWGSVLAGSIGETALPEIHRLLDSNDWKVRCNGLVAIERIRSELSLPFLLELLEDEYMTIRKLAVKCLGIIAIPKAKGHLLKLIDSGDTEMRLAVLEALACIGGEDLIEVFLEALNDENWLVQRQALKGIGRLRCPEFKEVLLNFTPREELEEDYINCIAVFRDPSFVKGLLKRMQGEVTVPRLQSLIYAIGEVEGFEESSCLIPFLKHPNWQLQKEAVDALGKLKSKDAINALKDKLNSADPVMKVHIKEALKIILGESVWQKMLDEYVTNSKREQADKFFHEARNKARDKTWKEVISLLKKSNALHQTLRNL
ncbi:MAG: HEAT repeat domain-containing protein, partial [bacterium]|nr:HEAT repeat domain-containing protein [bacterium]